MAVYRAHLAEQVYLVQKKVSPSIYDYVAIRATNNLINEKMRAGK